MRMRILVSIFALQVLLACAGCQGSTENNPANLDFSPTPWSSAKTNAAPEKSVRTNTIDVPKLAGKPVAELDRIFGPPAEAKRLDDGGEYRLYKTSDQPKGLSVRFYNGRARSFNLILEKSFSTSKEALKKSFGIDVGNLPPAKDPKEPLSEVYRGTFGSVKFTKVSAKKQSSGSGFMFVLAEAAG